MNGNVNNCQLLLGDIFTLLDERRTEKSDAVVIMS